MSLLLKGLFARNISRTCTSKCLINSLFPRVLSRCPYSTVQAKEFEEPPPKYTTSKAAKWKASDSFSGPESDEPWYQPHIILLSTTIFMIYFCILREENDIDEQLGKSPFENVPGREKQHLVTTIAILKSQGKDYSQYEIRLKQLQAEEKASV